MNIKLSEAQVEYCDKKTIILQWAGNIGYGELVIYKENDGWKADTECMCSNNDKEFIKEVLNKWIESIEVVG